MGGATLYYVDITTSVPERNEGSFMRGELENDLPNRDPPTMIWLSGSALKITSITEKMIGSATEYFDDNRKVTRRYVRSAAPTETAVKARANAAIEPEPQGKQSAAPRVNREGRRMNDFPC